MSLRINLAALTEGELLALYGPQEMQARLPDISRARLDGRPLLDLEIPVLFPAIAFVSEQERVWGITPEQSQAIARQHARLLEEKAVYCGMYSLFVPSSYARAYLLGETAIALHWSETSQKAGKPEIRLLTWLRDRASGLACVLTTDAALPLSPTPSEEIDTHVHPELPVLQLIKSHQQHVLRLGRPMKLPAESPWFSAWQAAYDLNLAAWKRRGVVVASA